MIINSYYILYIDCDTWVSRNPLFKRTSLASSALPPHQLRVRPPVARGRPYPRRHVRQRLLQRLKPPGRISQGLLRRHHGSNDLRPQPRRSVVSVGSIECEMNSLLGATGFGATGYGSMSHSPLCRRLAQAFAVSEEKLV